MEESLLESLCMSESSEERATGEMDFVPWGEKGHLSIWSQMGLIADFLCLGWITWFLSIYFFLLKAQILFALMELL